MRRAVWWGVGVVVALGMVGLVWGSLESSESPKPRKPKVTNRVGTIDPGERTAVRRDSLLMQMTRVRADRGIVTAETIDEALREHESGIGRCIEAARVHSERVTTPIRLVLSLIPETAGAQPGLRVGKVQTGIPLAEGEPVRANSEPGVTAELDRCLAQEFRTLRFDGDEALEVRASWPPDK